MTELLVPEVSCETKPFGRRFPSMAFRTETTSIISPKGVTGKTALFDRARRKFLRKFPGGFKDETYLAWERDYKWEAHQEWTEALNENAFRKQLRQGAFALDEAELIEHLPTTVQLDLSTLISTFYAINKRS